MPRSVLPIARAKAKNPFLIVAGAVLALNTLTCGVDVQPGAATPTEAASTFLRIWDDLLEYPGARLIEGTGDWKVPNLNLEHLAYAGYRQYKADGTPEQITQFYRDELPKHGWKEVMPDENRSTTMRMWQKKDGTSAASILIWAKSDGTFVLRLRATVTRRWSVYFAGAPSARPREPARGIA